LCKEIEQIAACVESPGLSTVYIGGGTPSLLTPGQIASTLDSVNRNFGILPGAEISIESNPGTVTTASLSGYRSAGVNRLNIGAQSMNEYELKALGRKHDPAAVAEAVSAARAAGFENVNVDLMYGGPGGTLESWRQTLNTVTDLRPDHLSLYSLIVELGTRFNRLFESGRLALPPDDTVADMYDVACEALAAAGFEHYEVANWSRPGMQAAHNLAYWRNEEFFAAGVGAYGYVRPNRFYHVRGTKKYIDAIMAGKDGIGGNDFVDPLDERFETVVMRLRLLDEGLDARVYEERFAERLDDRYGSTIAELVELGFLERIGSAVRLREVKVPLANEAWARFLPDRNRSPRDSAA
jgi:oxygen-independent coproporphyrinogen-3 oxidase